MNKCIILLALTFITLTPMLTACGTDDDPITDIPVQPNPEELAMTTIQGAEITKEKQDEQKYDNSYWRP